MTTDFEKAKSKYPEIFYYYDGLTNTKVSQSVHPAGMIISPITLDDTYGTFFKDDGECLMLDMDEAHAVGLAKYDFLVLKTVQVIRDTCNYLGEKYPKTHEINWDDQDVWADIIKDPTGVFQFEGKFAFDCLKKFKPTSIFDMSLVTACIRPSGASYRDDLLAKHKHNNPSSIIDELLNDNLGYLCIEGNQKVDTKRGFVPIKDVEIGDYVKTRSGFQRVLDSRKTGYKELLDIKFLGNHLLVTPEHKVLTDRGWVESKNLKAGDVVAYRVGDPVISSDVNPNLARAIEWLVEDESEVKSLVVTSKQIAYDIQTAMRNLGRVASVTEEIDANDEMHYVINMFSTTHQNVSTEGNIVWTEVQEISPHDSADVYDITVENEHEFVCQGIVVHNCYQEDTIKFLQQICGLSGSEADTIRRAIGHKDKDKLNQALPRILDGYCSKSSQPREIAEQEAREFLKVIEDSANYQFGYNHSIAYCLLGYLCAYYRYYHPIEFLTSFLNNAANDNDIQAGTAYAQKIGINMVNPQWGLSRGHFFFNTKEKIISKGIASIKYMGDAVADELYNLSQSKDYEYFTDLLMDVKQFTSVDTRQLDILIKIDFFKQFGNQRELLRMVDIFTNLFKSGKAAKIKRSLVDGTSLEPIISKFSVGVTKSGGEAKSYTLLDVRSILHEIENAIANAGMDDLDCKLKIQNFYDAFGYYGYVSGAQEDRPKLLVLNTYPLHRKKDGKLFGYSVVTKSIGSGVESRFTCFSGVYNKAPVDRGDIIMCKRYTRDGKYFILDAYEKLY